jgi:hypothetical protein
MATCLLPAGFLTSPMPWFARPNVAHNDMGVVNSIGRFQIATASFRRDTKYSRSFTAPVHADGAGGLGMF